MGGKGGDSGGSNQQDQASSNQLAQTQAQANYAQQKQKVAATAEPKAPAEPVTPPVTEAVQQPTEQTAAPTANLTGLGDQLVAGMSPGRSQTILDPTKLAGIPTPTPLGNQNYQGSV